MGDSIEYISNKSGFVFSLIYDNYKYVDSCEGGQFSKSSYGKQQQHCVLYGDVELFKTIYNRFVQESIERPSKFALQHLGGIQGDLNRQQVS